MSLVLIVVAGYSAWVTLPRLEDPFIINRFAYVVTQFPGATAQRVESQITEKIEDDLQTQSEIKEINSVSRPGLSIVNIELTDAITNSDPVWTKLRDRLNKVAIAFPPGASVPILDEERSYAFTQLIAIYAPGKKVSLNQLVRYATALKRDLLRLPGTDYARTFGSPKEEVLVDVNAKKLRAIGLSIQEVANKVRAADSKNPAGSIDHPLRQYNLEVDGEFLDLRRIGQVPIGADKQGQIVRLENIASVRHAIQEPPRELSDYNSEQAVIVALRILPNQKIDSWAKQVDHVLQKFQAGLPKPLAAKVIFNQEQYTNLRLKNLGSSLVVGICFVILAVLLILGWRASVAITLVLPLTVLMALFIMSLFGFAIHQISIIGLIISMGLVVDTAIVMVNAISRKIRYEKTPQVAISSVVHQYLLPLFSSTATTILAFMPIIFLTGPIGEFVLGIGSGVIIALICSYVLSFTVIPALAGRLMAGHPNNTRWWQRGIRLTVLSRRFQRMIYFSIKHAKITVPLALLIPVLGFLVMPHLTEQFFPRTDRNQFFMEVFLPEQTSIYRTQEITREINKVLKQLEEITNVTWFIGQSTPTFYYNKTSGNDGLSSSAEAIVNVRKIKDIQPVTLTLQKQLDKLIPEAQIIVRNLWQGPPYRSPIEIKIFGPSLQTLNEIGLQMRKTLQSIPGISHTRNSIILGLPKLHISADEDRLGQLGLSLNTVADDLQESFNGIVAGSVIQGPEEIPVRVRLDDQSRRNFQAIDDYYLLRQNGLESHEIGLPMKSYAQRKVVPSSARITHLNGERVNIINGFIMSNVLPQAPLDQFKTQLGNVKLPFGYSMQYGGEVNERAEALGNLFAKINVIIVLMLALLVLTFNSFRYMLLIAFVGIQSIGLGMLSLYLFNYPLGFVSMISMMGLLGVAINASIIIITNLRYDVRARGGDPAAMSRVIITHSARHIFATTLTTMFGFMPLLFTSSDMWPPFAAAFIGGIALTTIVSFFFVPATYHLMTKTKPL